MPRFPALRVLLLLVALALGMGTLPAGALAQSSPPGEDPDFASLQERGAMGMGVDQYASTHLFDALPDGGRIEYQYDRDDPDGIARIRRHLKEIQEAFQAGDFSTPAFVHGQEVPGTDVMAERRTHIEYRYQDLPRGGELRLVTEDPDALQAIREFMAFQREDHRAGGMDHSGMDHSGMDHSAMDHGSVDHHDADHHDMGHDRMRRGRMGMDRGDGHQGEMGQGGMRGGGMHQGGMHGGGMHGGGMGRSATERTQHHLEMGGGDAAFAADMDIIHELLMNHDAITRTVVHLPNGIQTLTESPHPEIAALIVAHVASMERRLEAGEVFNLFSHTLPAIFENHDRIHSEFEYTERGVAVVQTSDVPALVEALQGHADEVTEMVDEGMVVMMRGMMQRRMEEGEGMRGPGARRGPPSP